MNTFTRLTAVTTALLCLTLSTMSYATDKKWAKKMDSSIVDFAVSASGEPFDFDSNGKDFDVLVAALIATNTVAVFDGNDFTVFAPEDQAFYDLTGTDNDADAFTAVVALLGEEGVASVLAYHVSEGVRNSRSVTRAKTIKMLDGNTIRFENGIIVAGQSEAGLLNIDNRLNDGMVHIIDTVLVP